MSVGRIFRRRPLPQSPVCRRGLFSAVFTGTGWTNKGDSYSAMVEVSEIGRAGSLSKIRIDKITGVGDSHQTKQARDLIAEWVPTSSVQWFDTDGSAVPEGEQS